MDRIMEQLRAYCPWNEQEEADCAELLRRLGQREDIVDHKRRESYSQEIFFSPVSCSCFLFSVKFCPVSGSSLLFSVKNVSI